MPRVRQNRGLCASCGLVAPDLQYRDGRRVCVLCADLLERLDHVGAHPHQVRLSSEAVALMGGITVLNQAQVAPLLYERPARENRGAGLLVALLGQPEHPATQECFSRIAGERRVQFAHPLIVRRTLARFGRMVQKPERPSVRVAGGHIDPVLVSIFTRDTIVDYGLLPCRVSGRTLLAASSGRWPPADRQWPDRFADKVKRSAIGLAHSADIRIREVSASEFKRALEAAPWGAPLRFAHRDVSGPPRRS